MDSLATCNPPAAAARLQSRSAEAGTWATLRDRARGQRRFRRAGRGLPAEWVQADGTRLSFAHDDAGSLRRIGCGDWFVAIDAPPHRPTMSVRDPRGRTDLSFLRGGRLRTISRDADTFALEVDRHERPVRVAIPGSRVPLRYEWDAEGGCVVRAGDGAAILTLSARGGARRTAVAPDTFIEEEIALGWVVLRAVANGAPAETVTLRLRNLSAIAERRWSDGALETYARDSRGRLSAWTRGGASGGWEYAEGNLVLDAAGRRELDEAGRVTALRRVDGSVVRYRYDACGRRIAGADDGGATGYADDPLGALVRVEAPDGRVTECVFDGMGRRVSVRTGAAERREQRDEFGRLWSICDAQGRALHTYIWIGDRIA